MRVPIQHPTGRSAGERPGDSGGSSGRSSGTASHLPGWQSSAHPAEASPRCPLPAVPPGQGRTSLRRRRSRLPPALTCPEGSGSRTTVKKQQSGSVARAAKPQMKSKAAASTLRRRKAAWRRRAMLTTRSRLTADSDRMITAPLRLTTYKSRWQTTLPSSQDSVQRTTAMKGMAVMKSRSAQKRLSTRQLAARSRRGRRTSSEMPQMFPASDSRNTKARAQDSPMRRAVALWPLKSEKKGK